MSINYSAPGWNHELPPTQAFADFDLAAIDHAMITGKGNSLDGKGILYAYLSPEEFLAYTGQARQPRVNPGPPAGNREEIARNVVLSKAFDTQQAFVDGFQAHCINTIPAYLLEPMKDVNDSLATRTLEYMITDLRRRLGTLTKQDIADLHTKLKVLFVYPGHIETHLAVMQKLLRKLARANQPIAPSMAIDLIMGGFSHLDLTDCWIKFYFDFPVVANQTVERLCNSITVFVNTVLPLKATKSNLSMSVAVEQQSQIDALEVQLIELRSALSIHQSAKPAKAPKTSGPTDQSGQLARPPTGQSGQPARPPISPAEFATAPFCWSHGPGYHTSDACSRPFPNHKTQATWAKQCGSNWRRLFKGQGRPIA